MCEECEESAPLREVYLARRARMAQTWRPKGPARWRVEAVASAAVLDVVQPDAGPESIAAE